MDVERPEVTGLAGPPYDRSTTTIGLGAGASGEVTGSSPTRTAPGSWVNHHAMRSSDRPEARSLSATVIVPCSSATRRSYRACGFGAAETVPASSRSA